MSEGLTADEAADYLSVSRGTLYSYVSRGLVASEPGPGPSRARRYPRADLDAFIARRERNADRELAAHGALDWGRPVLDSELTLIEDGRLRYRGRDAVELAGSAGLEEVAALLWTGSPEAARTAPAPTTPPARRATPAAAMAAWLLEAGDRTLVTAAAPEAVVIRSAWATLGGLFAAAGARGAGTLAERLARGWGTDRADDLRAALVLCADHELNISSFTARCVASADARLEHALLAALCALRGRRHGGLTERVEALLGEAERDGPAAAAERATSPGGDLPGFGHRLYPGGDPRAACLLARCGPPAREGSTGALIRLVGDQLGKAPNLDLGLAVLARSAGLPEGGALGIFALGRCVGWIAHVLEAGRDGRLIRPRSRYTGPRSVR